MIDLFFRGDELFGDKILSLDRCIDNGSIIFSIVNINKYAKRSSHA